MTQHTPSHAVPPEAFGGQIKAHGRLALAAALAAAGHRRRRSW